MAGEPVLTLPQHCLVNQVACKVCSTTIPHVSCRLGSRGMSVYCDQAIVKLNLCDMQKCMSMQGRRQGEGRPPGPRRRPTPPLPSSLLLLPLQPTPLLLAQPPRLLLHPPPPITSMSLSQRTARLCLTPLVRIPHQLCHPPLPEAAIHSKE